MTRIKDTLLILLLVLVVGDMSVKRVEAQAITGVTPWGYTITGTLANCPALSTIPVGTGVYCSTNTGPYFAAGGATSYTSLLPGAAATPQITIQGVTKTLPANFTITVAPPAVTATSTAPTVTAN